MAVEHKKSFAISNRDSAPIKITNAYIIGSVVKEAVGKCTVQTTDSVGSTYTFCQIPTGARVSQVLISTVGSNTAGCEYGLRRPTDKGGNIIDSAFFSSELKPEEYKQVDIAHSAGNFQADKAELPLWKALGLDEDPQGFYDVVATLTTVPTADQELACKVRYIF